MEIIVNLSLMIDSIREFTPPKISMKHDKLYGIMNNRFFIIF